MSPEEHAMLSDLMTVDEAASARTAEERCAVGWSREVRRRQYEDVARTRAVRRRTA